jgi:hypothetical protein
MQGLIQSLSLAEKDSANLEWDEAILLKYLAHASKRKDMAIPEFKGLPKVHKTPWTLRPIIPSHSWITASMSQVADYLLRPLVNESPWIVNSTIEVINGVRNAKITEHEDLWFVTGDVQSFYTNVPVLETIALIENIAKDKQWPSWKVRMIRSCLTAVMSHNCFSYQEEIYWQHSGIAMGTSVAPAFANIYAAQFENNISCGTTFGLRFYCRYIDDILLMFRGTRSQVETFLQERRYGNLNVTWNIRSYEEGIDFLDAKFFFSGDPGRTDLQSCLFRKSLNKHMYIPWSSAHPESVKRSFIKAEMTRLLVVSSNKSLFEESRLEFYGNLLRRGYPQDKLKLWMREVQYTNRISVLLSKGNKNADRGVPLLFPSSYNDIWKYMNLNEVFGKITGYWSHRGLVVPDELRGPVIKSLRRTENLFDKASTWNVEVLTSGGIHKRSHLEAFGKLEIRGRIGNPSIPNTSLTLARPARTAHPRSDVNVDSLRASKRQRLESAQSSAL